VNIQRCKKDHFQEKKFQQSTYLPSPHQSQPRPRKNLITYVSQTIMSDLGFKKVSPPGSDATAVLL
jgi:hypothetical protein